MAMLIKRPSVNSVHGSCCWPPMIYCRKLVSVLACHLLMGHLLGSRLNVVLSHCRKFLRSWPGCNAAWAVKTHPVINRSVVNYRTVNISIMNYRPVYIYHSCIITEPSATPLAANKTITIVSAAIINTTIETYMRPPITDMKTIVAALITPIGRGP